MTDTQHIYQTGIQLWNQWTRMWNERPELAREIVASEFALHLTTPGTVDQTTITSPESVLAWVHSHRARFKRLTFDTRVGPFVDVVKGVVAGPWYADLNIDGKDGWACGMDTIAFHAGKITEYWTLSKEVDEVGRWSTALVVQR